MSMREENDYSVVLPCDPKDFKTFISGLLGKAQTVTSTFEGSFELDKDEVVNIYHLVEQRVHQQNEASLLQFSIMVNYNDNSSVTLNSIDEFSHYREVKPLVSMAASLSWVYLIKFRDKTTPEKQTIELSFTASSHKGDMGNTIRLTIEHTARTWATDIQSLISGHVSAMLKSETKFRKFINEYNETIGLSFGILFFLSTLICGFLVSRNISHSYSDNLKNLIEQGRDNVADKLDILLNLYATGYWAKFYFGLVWFIIISIILSIIVGSIVGSRASHQKKSFILFTQKANEAKNEYITSSEKWLPKLIYSVIISIITGVLANYIFLIVSKYMMIR